MVLLSLVWSCRGDFTEIPKHEIRRLKINFCYHSCGYDPKGKLTIDQFLNHKDVDVRQHFKRINFPNGYNKIKDIFSMLNKTFQSFGSIPEFTQLFDNDYLDPEEIYVLIQRHVPFDDFFSIIAFVNERKKKSAVVTEAEIVQEDEEIEEEEHMIERRHSSSSSSLKIYSWEDTNSRTNLPEEGLLTYPEDMLNRQRIQMSHIFTSLRQKETVRVHLRDGLESLPTGFFMFLDGVWTNVENVSVTMKKFCQVTGDAQWVVHITDPLQRDMITSGLLRLPKEQWLATSSLSEILDTVLPLVRPLENAERTTDDYFLAQGYSFRIQNPTTSRSRNKTSNMFMHTVLAEQYEATLESKRRADNDKKDLKEAQDKERESRENEKMAKKLARSTVRWLSLLLLLS